MYAKNINRYKVLYLKDNQKQKIVLDENQLSNFEYDIIKISKVNNIKNILNINTKLNTQDILDIFSQIDMMLNANISFIDTLELLIKNEKNIRKLDILNSMINSLNQGKLLENELKIYKKELSNVVLQLLSLGQKNGNLKQVVKIIVEILNKKVQTKKSYLDAMSYPIVLSITFIISVCIIFGYVIPAFEPLFLQYGNNLPLMTKILLDIKDFFYQYSFIILLIFLIFGFILYNFYKKSESFKLNFDKFLLVDIPIISKLILLSNMLIIFLSLKLLIKQKYKFQESIFLVIELIQNRYLKDIFIGIYKDIVKGRSIQDIFIGIDIFDDIVKKLITIGHRSDQFELVLDKIVTIYQLEYNKKLKQTIKLIEPLFLIIIALLIMWMMLAIFIPMWDMNKVM
jgi:general secretion pathway protein F